MNIVSVNTRHCYGGGDSTYNFNLAKLLRDKGHSVTFFAMQDSRNLPDPNSDLFVSYIDFRDLNRSKNPINGVRVLARSIYSVEARKKFSKLLDRFQPDIVHIQNLHAHITPSVIFEAKKRGLPVVWTLHDYKLICPNSTFMIDKSQEICEACRGGRFYSPIKNRCKKNSLLACVMISLEAYVHRILRVCDYVDAFIAPSNFLKSKLLENGFPADKVFHNPLFLPESLLVNRKDNEPFRDDYFLFLGRLSNDKGINHLIEAGRLLSDRNIKIVLAGRVEEPLRSELSRLLPPNVEYVGMKSGGELDDLRKNCKAVLLPSIWYENQPFAILEAFAFGKPAIGSDLGGIRELVGNNERGILIKPRSPESLADAIVELNNDHITCKQMGEKAYQYVMENHTPEKHYQKLLKIYEQVISK